MKSSHASKKTYPKSVGEGATRSEAGSFVRDHALVLLGRISLGGAVLALIVAALFGLFSILERAGVIPPPAFGSGTVGIQALLAQATAAPTPTQTSIPPTPTVPPPPIIAIVAGHWSHEDPAGVVTIHDTGAICEDGLREVSINKSVADKVVARLQGRGYRVDLLQEFDPLLKEDNPDYAPALLLAIHTDSCVHGPDYPLATGYKIAHAEPSDNPEEDDRLVACLRRDYDPVVRPYNMTFNENTITSDMTAYHAFREIVPTSPAAIIELGFMYNDRVALTQHQDGLAQGLATGLLDFLKGDRCGIPESPTPTPTIAQ